MRKKRKTNKTHIKAEMLDWPDHLPRAIAFDVDGTLSDNRKLVRKLNGKPIRGCKLFGEPNHKIIKGMYYVKKLGFEIAIFTARAKSETKSLKHWLKKHQVPYDYLWIDQKPPFIVLVDDRVIDSKKKSWFKDLQYKLNALHLTINGE
ncbi:MAG: hypothetical protein HY606_12555 [Planctomycetes bacterium]|nr:hypothetical protein [Planctomycetota bacterium]